MSFLSRFHAGSIFTKTGFALFFLLVLGLGLRLWGIGFGLPYEYHVDEVQYVRQAASMGQHGLEPVWWNNPPFYKYLFLLEYGILFVVGKVLGLYESAADFGAKNTLDPTMLYLLGRGTTAVLGTLTIFVIWKLGKTAYRQPVGWLAAIFLAVCFIHVRDSHFAVNDIATTLLTTIGLLAAIKIANTGMNRWYVLAGIALGIGTSTKYSAIFASTTILAAHLLSPHVKIRSRKWAVKPLLVFVGVAIIASIAASPYFVITPRKVIHDAYEALYLAGQHGFDGWKLDPSGGFVYYAKTLWWGLGSPLFLLSIWGAITAIWRHTRTDIIVIIHILTFYLMFGRQEMYFARFILPLVPPFLLLAAVSADQVSTYTNQRLSGTKWPLPKYAIVLFIALVLLPSLISSMQFNHLLSQTDTRTIAKQWFEANVDEGAKVGVDWIVHGPPLSTVEEPKPNSLRVYELYSVENIGLSAHSLEWYRENHYDYLITSSFITNLPLADDLLNNRKDQFYQQLEQELDLVVVFEPGRSVENIPFVFDELYGPAVSLWYRDRPGPVLRVYRLQKMGQS